MVCVIDALQTPYIKGARGDVELDVTNITFSDVF